MKTILTVFRKEWMDTLRDRRTLITMVVIPLLLLPGVMTLTFRIEAGQSEREATRVLRVGFLGNGNAAPLRELLAGRADLRLREDLAEGEIESLIRADSLDAVIVVAPDFDRVVAALGAGQITLSFKSAGGLEIAKRRLLDLVNGFEKGLLAGRFRELRLGEGIVSAVRVEEHDVASEKEKAAKQVGGFLPYIFVIFCFMGSMYPAIDLGAGEKERGTLETLLASPAGRFEILLGKMGAVVLCGLLTAFLSLVGLFLAVARARLPPEFREVLHGMFAPGVVVLVASLLLPLTIFFASLLLAGSIFAGSFKEAQSLLSPMMIVVIFPVAVGMFPGITLNARTALIPVLNVSLAAKEVFAGTIKPVLLAEVYASLLLIAGLSLYGCARWFEREDVIFRGV